MDGELERTLSRYEQLTEARRIVEDYERRRGRLITRLATVGGLIGWWLLILGATGTDAYNSTANWIAALGACLFGPAIACGIVYAVKRI